MQAAWTRKFFCSRTSILLQTARVPWQPSRNTRHQHHNPLANSYNVCRTSPLKVKILLLKVIDSVADGTSTMATIEKHTTPKSQLACEFLQRVLNKSVERQTEYQCNTRSVRRDCAIESTRRECDVCNLRGSHLGSRAKILVLDQLSAAVGRPVCFCEYFGLGSSSQYHVDNISDPEEGITCARHGCTTAVIKFLQIPSMWCKTSASMRGRRMRQRDDARMVLVPLQ